MRVFDHLLQAELTSKDNKTKLGERVIHVTRIGMNKSTSKKPYVLSVLLTMMILGCISYQSKLHPQNRKNNLDYDLLATNFAPLDFPVLLSDSLNDHIGEYIVFEGYFGGIVHDQPMRKRTRFKPAKDLQAFYVRERKHSVHHVQVVFPDDHSDLASQLLPLNGHRSILRVYGFLLPAEESVFLNNGESFRSLDETVIWLIRVRVVDDGGIQYKKQ